MVEGLEPGPVQVDSLELAREMAFLLGVVALQAAVDVREVHLLVGYKDRLAAAADLGAGYVMVVVCVLEMDLL